MHVWDEAKSILFDTETIGTINGVSGYMEKFSVFIGVALGELILGHSDNLSKSLQSKVLTAAQGQHQAELTVKTLESLRNDDDASFNLFLDAVLFKAEQCDVDPPVLPRKRIRPMRYDEGSEPTEYKTPKDMYQVSYFEALDLVIEAIKKRFDQPGYQIYQNLQELLMKCVTRQCYDLEFQNVCKFYGSDIKPTCLKVQHQLLHSAFREKPIDDIDIQSVFLYIRSQG
uniref:Uncharacterized protein n=1 Tax=Amphimedon queenslandica TaxID=400682 RepID=A0A1X7UYM0_AMPQE